MKYFVDKRTEKIFIVLIINDAYTSMYSCYDDEEQYNVVKNAFKMLHKYSTSSFDNEHISNVLKMFENEYDEKTRSKSQQTNTIKRNRPSSSSFN